MSVRETVPSPGLRRQAIFPADRQDLYQKHRYSAAILSGDLLFVSGQVGSREDGSPEPHFERQVRLAFDHLKATLLVAGCGLDDIVDVTTYSTDPEKQFETVLAVKDEVFPQAPYPNWTAVGVNWLAGFDFEIKVIARVPVAVDDVRKRGAGCAISDAASARESDKVT